MRRLAPFVILIASLAATAFGQHKNPAGPLLQTDRDFARATVEHRLEGWLQFFSDDAVIMTRPPRAGLPAIRDYYTRVFADPDFKLEWRPLRGELLPAGTLGYTVGEFTMTRKDETGALQKAHGHYITIWRKQADGSWKVAGDVGATLPSTSAQNKNGKSDKH